MGRPWRAFGSMFAMAFREVRRNAMRSALTTLGVNIGVAAVIALVTLGDGATHKVTQEIANFGVNQLVVIPGSERQGGPDIAEAPPFSIEDVRAIERELSAVSLVAPSALGSALAVYQNQSWDTQVRGTRNEFFEVRGVKIDLGRMFSEAELSRGSPVCILGQSALTALFGKVEALGQTVRLERLSCTVIGTTVGKGTSTFGEDQDSYVLVPLKLFQRRMSGKKDINNISVSTHSEASLDKVKQQLVALFRERRHRTFGEEDDFVVFDSREFIATFETISGALTALLGAIAAISLLVGGIGVMNIMLVSVTERTREIGIRLAIGARAREVLMQFLIESVLLCLVGGLLGVVFGLGGAYLAADALDLPFRFLPQIIAIAVLCSSVIGVVFGFMPARRAARLNPIEALRYE